MNRPYIICHMMTSIDGKVTGDFLFRDECSAKSEIILISLSRKSLSSTEICRFVPAFLVIRWIL